MKYTASTNFILPVFPFSKKFNFGFINSIRELLNLEPQQRPSAQIVLQEFIDGPVDLDSRYEWTTGGDERLRHIDQVGSGWSGDVHEVTPRDFAF